MALSASQALSAGTANPDEVTHWAEELPDTYILCRDLGHNWRPFHAWWDANDRAFVRILRCRNCRGQREQVLDHLGRAVKNAYEYADGYQRPAGAGRMDADGRGALRLISMQRLMDDAKVAGAPPERAAETTTGQRAKRTRKVVPMKRTPAKKAGK